MRIQLKNLSKQYQDTEVLTNINTEIREGEFFVLVGPSGSGKSTLLRMIAGLIPTTNGQIYFDDQDVTNDSPKDRHLAMVFQNYALLPFLSVQDNIRFGIRNLGLSKTEEEARIFEALNMVHLLPQRHRKPKALSGGQQQRVALARAIATKAPLVLMDEPLSNLDAQLRSEMRQEIVRLHKEIGMTLIYVTHDQVEAMTMGDRVMVLNDRQIQQVGTPLELYNRPKNEFVGEFIGSPRMNIIDVQVDETGQSIQLPFKQKNGVSMAYHLTEAIPSGRYRLGIRPEDLQVSFVDQGSHKQIMPVKIEAVANLGKEAVLTVTNSDSNLFVNCKTQVDSDCRQAFVKLPSIVDQLHLFEAEHGNTVDLSDKIAAEQRGVIDAIS
ncbi:ABC transporter ATP-binding protein [Agrilactobacillus fermenti]|uniref:ABC transporter ATP-binding protein n=1 Tax=Agrilactobacillus fermenti TaxID=2586909 RepID=UPI003A5BA20A